MCFVCILERLERTNWVYIDRFIWKQLPRFSSVSDILLIVLGRIIDKNRGITVYILVSQTHTCAPNIQAFVLIDISDLHNMANKDRAAIAL